MGKSSSSLQKTKHSRDSSKLRSVKKKKTKRNKSKKIRRVKDYSDESESSGSDSSSSSYSSSEDDYRRKKKRRSKVSKKRSRKRYSSTESDNDDDYDNGDDTRLLKKKKRSKRKDEHVGKTKKKKKISSRKRRKRDSSLSPTSSSEQSDDGSESDGKRRTRDRERLGKVKDARRRSRDELEEDSEPDKCWQVEDEVIPEKNPRRLKSIIVVSCSYGNDERREEDDHDVYMTRRGDRELGDSEESDERNGETTISYARTRADDNGRKTVGYDEFGETNRSETSKSFHLDNSSMKDDDLEAILKQRALENLKRFRGATQKSEIARKEVSSVSEGEPLQIESEKVESQDRGLMEQKLSVSTGSKDLETSQKILQVVNVKESGTALANIASQEDNQSGDTTKGKAYSGISSCTTKRKLIRPVLGQESINLASMKEASGSQDAEAESINGSTIDKNLPESSLAQATKNGSENIEPNLSCTLKAHSSSHADTETLDEIKGESQSEQKTMDETKDESQYEQKTMTVMRGGELVQVSYKVYIPKKTSSLGRRQFKR